VKEIAADKRNQQTNKQTNKPSMSANPRRLTEGKQKYVEDIAETVLGLCWRVFCRYFFWQELTRHVHSSFCHFHLGSSRESCAQP
jgi:hypothetical protein